MKVYYVINARMPSERAHGIQIAKMCEAFALAGMDFELVLPNRKNVVKSDIRSFYALKRDIPVKKIPVVDTYQWGRIGFLFASVSFMVSYFLFLFWKKVRGEKFIIYTIDMDQFSCSFIPFLRSPYFVEIHDAKEKGFLYNFLFQRAAGIITINNLIKEKLMKEFSLSAEKIIVHPNGIDLPFFAQATMGESLRKHWNIDPKKKIVLYTGKCYGWKGMDILLEAAKDFPPDLLLYIVGGSKEELEKTTGKPVPQNVVCIGQRPYKEIPSWLSLGDVLVVLGTKDNTYSYYYTSPMKIFEYMTAGKPIVASNTPAVNQIVSGEEVIFYTPDDASNLAQQITIAHEKKADILQKIERARVKVKTYSWENRAQSVLSFISART